MLPASYHSWTPASELSVLPIQVKQRWPQGETHSYPSQMTGQPPRGELVFFSCCFEVRKWVPPVCYLVAWNICIYEWIYNIHIYIYIGSRLMVVPSRYTMIIIINHILLADQFTHSWGVYLVWPLVSPHLAAGEASPTSPTGGSGAWQKLMAAQSVSLAGLAKCGNCWVSINGIPQNR